MSPFPPDQPTSVPSVARAARAAWEALEPLHNVMYFAPEVQEHLTAAGLKGRLMPYFAGRAAPLGPVSPEVLTALFYNFNPVSVSTGMGVGEGWDFASPEAVVEARYEAIDACLLKLLGEDAAGEHVAEAAKLARTAAEGAAGHLHGRPVYAAYANLPWPEAPHLQLWHAQTLLREFRGDGHMSVLLTAGVSGLEALVLFVATEKVDGEALRLTRGWPSSEWRATVRSLQAQGLLEDGDEPDVTPAGARLRTWIEERTDLLALPAYAAIGEEGCLRLAELGREISRPVLEADLIPWLKKRRVASRRMRSRAVSRAGR